MLKPFGLLLACSLVPMMVPVVAAEGQPAPTNPAPLSQSLASPPAYLGVRVDRSDPALTQQLGIDQGFGLTILSLQSDSPATKAGLQPHDVLLQLDDQLLVMPQQLLALISRKQPGETISLMLVRSGQKHTVSIPLAERPAELSENENTLFDLNIEGSVNGRQLRDLFDQREAIKRTLDEIKITGKEQLRESEAKLKEIIEAAEAQARTLTERTIELQDRAVSSIKGSTVMALTKDGYTITASKNDDSSTLSIIDAAGTKLYEGDATTCPTETFPEAVQDLLKKFSNFTKPSR